MLHTRHQWLIIVGSLSSFGLALLTYQALTGNNLPAQTQPNFPNSSSLLTASPAPQGVSAPPRGDIRLAVISDLNSQYGSTTYEPEVGRGISLIPEWQPDLVLCGGDMVAGQKRSLTEAQIKGMWAAFDRHIASPLRKANLPFGFTIGNHDGSGAIAKGRLAFARERELAAAYWNHPNHDPGLKFIDRAKFPFYYSFTQKGVFYLVWDASTHQISPEQLNWLKNSLGSPAARQARMRIAIGHLPLYAVAVGRNQGGNYLSNADQLRSLLEKYGVHTYISGHHHAYYPGKRGQLELLHAGALGSGPRKLLNSNLPPRKTLTIVDIQLNSPSTVYTTYDMKTLAVIDMKTLPPKIVAPNGTIWRRDL